MPSDLFSKLIFAICKLLAGPCSCMQPPVSPIAHSCGHVALPLLSGHYQYRLEVGDVRVLQYQSDVRIWVERCRKCIDTSMTSTPPKNSRSRSSSQVPTNSSKSIAPFLSTSSSTHSVLPSKTAWGITASKRSTKGNIQVKQFEVALFQEIPTMTSILTFHHLTSYLT